MIAVKRALSAIREAAEIFKTESEAMIETISKEYGILKEDARQWYSGVDIRAHRYVSQIALETALQVLCETGVLEEDLAITVDKLTSSLFSFVSSGGGKFGIGGRGAEPPPPPAEAASMSIVCIGNGRSSAKINSTVGLLAATVSS